MLDLRERPNVADAALDRAAARVAEFEAEMITRARQAVSSAVKTRARVYLDNPERRDTVAIGLWFAAPECLIATGRTVLNNAARFPRHLYGFGAEVEAINGKALIVVGRYERRRLYLAAKGDV